MISHPFGHLEKLPLPRPERSAGPCKPASHLTFSWGDGIPWARLTNFSRCPEICASFNEEVKCLLEKKLSVIQEKSIRDFANSCIENEIKRRNLRYEHIKKLAARFGDDCKNKLEEEIKNQNRTIINDYDKLFNNRNHAAHSQTIKVTLNEVKDCYEKAHLVLDCLKRAPRKIGQPCPRNAISP